MLATSGALPSAAVDHRTTDHRTVIAGYHCIEAVLRKALEKFILVSSRYGASHASCLYFLTYSQLIILCTLVSSGCTVHQLLQISMLNSGNAALLGHLHKSINDVAEQHPAREVIVSIITTSCCVYINL